MMKIISVLAVVGMLCPQLAFNNPLLEPHKSSAAPNERNQGEKSLSATAIIRKEIDNWQLITGITITAEAQSEIQSDFAKNEEFLRPIYVKRELNEPAKMQLLGDLVSYYLYEVRDRVLKTLLAEEKQNSRKMIGDPGINENAKPVYIAPTTKAGTHVIVKELDAKDLLDFSVGAFFKSIAQVLNGDTGRLFVSSKPDQASIKIDGQDKGFTDKRFVVSAGKHQVATVKPTCSHPVDVAAGQTVDFVCPP
jgi:hypothetical protein